MNCGVESVESKSKKKALKGRQSPMALSMAPRQPRPPLLGGESARAKTAAEWTGHRIVNCEDDDDNDAVVVAIVGFGLCRWYPFSSQTKAFVSSNLSHPSRGPSPEPTPEKFPLLVFCFPTHSEGKQDIVILQNRNPGRCNPACSFPLVRSLSVLDPFIVRSLLPIPVPLRICQMCSSFVFCFVS